MPTSISAERVFSTLDRVKTRLRNSMADERLSYLVTCSTCPEMVESVNLVNLCNAFVEKTGKTGIRKIILVNSHCKILPAKRKVLNAIFKIIKKKQGKARVAIKS